MTVRKGLGLFVLIAVVASSAVLLCSLDRSALAILARADRRFVLLACLLVVLTWLLDAVKMMALVRAAGERIRPKLALLLVWLNYFGCAITPMQSGGGPFQIYLLYRNAGIPVGKGVAITLVRTLLTLFILGLSVPLAALIDPSLIEGHRILRGFFSYVIFFILISWGVVALSLLRPGLLKRWGSAAVLWLKRFGFLPPRRVLRSVRRINREIDTYNDNIRFFVSQGKGWFMAGAVFAALHQWAQLSVLPCLIAALGLPVSYVQTILIQGIFVFLLYFVPTPGGSGAAEGGGAMVFRVLVPANLSGALAISWRFLTEYTGIILGVVVALRLLGFGLAEQLIREEEAPDSEDGGSERGGTDGAA
jgi:uncharacterized protein (TIRG00374 family)